MTLLVKRVKFARSSSIFPNFPQFDSAVKRTLSRVRSAFLDNLLPEASVTLFRVPRDGPTRGIEFEVAGEADEADLRLSTVVFVGFVTATCNIPHDSTPMSPLFMSLRRDRGRDGGAQERNSPKFRWI